MLKTFGNKVRQTAYLLCVLPKGMLFVKTVERQTNAYRELSEFPCSTFILNYFFSNRFQQYSYKKSLTTTA